MDQPPWKEEEAAVGGGDGGPPQRPTLTLPPRTDALFSGGFSPGPMTLLSNLFADGGDDGKSFSQLLAGSMVSPAPVTAGGLDSSGFFSHPQVKILFYVYSLCLLNCTYIISIFFWCWSGSNPGPCIFYASIPIELSLRGHLYNKYYCYIYVFVYKVKLFQIRCFHLDYIGWRSVSYRLRGLMFKNL